MGMHFFELRGRELILTGANPAADHILGRTHAELLGLPIERVLPGLVGTEALSRLRRVASRGGQWHDHAFEYTDDAASGTFDVAAFRHSRNQVATVFVDVTQRRLVEEKERRYRTRLSAMAAQLTATEDSERRKLAEELHDRVGQPLAVARMHLNSACTLEGGIDPGELALAQELLEDAIRQTRTITISLSPPVLYELGLHAALRWLRDELSEHYDLMVHLGPAADESGVSVEAKLVLFRAAHELALNVVKHSGTREAWMVLKSIDGWFTLTVLDQGCGLSSEVQASGMGESGFGLFSIKERVPHLGGRFDAQSGSGLGAVVSVSVPQSPVQ